MIPYRGRFAPSPTGPLHFGSLFAAVISYLEARSHHGEWLLRIEDIDPPREHPGAKERILETLVAHGMHWDGELVYQSKRSALYEQRLAQLASRKLSYSCPCSRKDLQAQHGQHSLICRTNQVTGLRCAIKFRVAQQDYSWRDGIQGLTRCSVQDDFVLQRKEGLYAYQLAVVADDIAQGITHVVRGSDLLDSTPMQLALYEALECPAPAFSHFPVLVDTYGQKLSKQNLAPAIDHNCATQNLLAVFRLLGLSLPKQPRSAGDAITMATERWHLSLVPRTRILYDAKI